ALVPACQTRAARPLGSKPSPRTVAVDCELSRIVVPSTLLMNGVTSLKSYVTRTSYVSPFTQSLIGWRSAPVVFARQVTPVVSVEAPSAVLSPEAASFSTYHVTFWPVVSQLTFVESTHSGWRAPSMTPPFADASHCAEL